METQCICHKCGAPWEAAVNGVPESSPQVCKNCGERSAKIVVEKK